MLKKTILLFCVNVIICSSVIQADVFRWDNGEKISDTVPEPYANFLGEQLRYADFRDLDLSGSNFHLAHLQYSDFTNTNLSKSNLTNATLSNSNLSNTDLSDAIIQKSGFAVCTDKGFTPAQLYSTLSYKKGILRGLDLSGNDLTGWDFSQQKLTRATFRSSDLSNANLSGTDLRGVSFQYTTLENTNLSDAITNYTFWGYSTDYGLTESQFYSTASYKNRDLRDIRLDNNDCLAKPLF